MPPLAPGSGPSPAATRTFRLDHPLDVRGTIGALGAGGRDPCLRRGVDGIWRATNTPHGPATIHVDDRKADRYRPGGRVTVAAWGAGAGWAVAHAGDLLGLADDPEQFRPTDAVVGDAHRRHPGLRFCRSLALSEALVPIILGQKVQSEAALRSWRRLVYAYGRPAPGPVAGLRLPPTAERLAGLPYQAFHRFDVERRRADTIRRVCARAATIDRLAAGFGRTTGCPSGEADAAGTDGAGIEHDGDGDRAVVDAVVTALRSIDGLGIWSATRAVQVALGATDAVVVGDYHMPHTVSWLLAGEPRGTDARMLELLAPYAGQRARAQRLLMGGGRAPRYGPRLSIRTFADC